MKVSFNIDKIIDSRATGLFVFGVTGAAKLASDYKKAPETEKDFTLLRDSLILGGTALGVGMYGLARSGVMKNRKIQNKAKSIRQDLLKPFKNTKIEKPAKYVGFHAKNIISNCADNAMMLISGILGALGADYGMRYSHLEKNDKIRKLSQSSHDRISTLYNYETRIFDNFKNSRLNNDLEHAVGSEVKSNIYSRITDLRAMRMFSRTMVGMQGFEVIEEKTFRKRMKHATSCLITNSLIPLFFLSTATSLTKKMNSFVRAPIIFASLVGGTMYTNKAIKNYEKRAAEKELEKQRNQETPKVEDTSAPDTEELLESSQ